MQAENNGMATLANSTGGKLFKNNNDFASGLTELAEPQVAYVLVFSPDPMKHDGKFHKLKVDLKGHGKVNVYARKGYFARDFKQVGRRGDAGVAPPVTTAKTNVPPPAEPKAAPNAAADAQGTVPPATRGDTAAEPLNETGAATGSRNERDV